MPTRRLPLQCRSKLACVKDAGYCAVKAQGTVAPEIAEIPTLTSVDMRGQAFSGPLPEWPVFRVPFETLQRGENNRTGPQPDT